MNSVITERFIYKDQLQPVAKLDGDGNILEQYVYGEISHTPGYIIKMEPHTELSATISAVSEK